MNNNLFINCPVYEAEQLRFRKVSLEDTQQLFQVYKDPITLAHMNNDNCGGKWPCHSPEVVRAGIQGWEREYDERFYIRWTIVNTLTQECIGTLELAPYPNTTRFFDGQCQSGILRVDVKSDLEKAEIFQAIFKMSIKHMFLDFDLQYILTKCRPEESQRRIGLRLSNYLPLEDKQFISYPDYHIANRPKRYQKEQRYINE